MHLMETDFTKLELMSKKKMTFQVHIGIIWVRKCKSKLQDDLICSSGEYLKDIDRIVVPQDPLLDHKVPRPLMERGHCGGSWSTLETSWEGTEQFTNRDCNSDRVDFLQPLSRKSSKVKVDIFIFCRYKTRITIFFTEHAPREAGEHFKGCHLLRNRSKHCYKG